MEISLVLLGTVTFIAIYEFIAKRIDKKYKFEYHVFDKDALPAQLEKFNENKVELVYVERVDIGRWIIITRRKK